MALIMKPAKQPVAVKADVPQWTHQATATIAQATVVDSPTATHKVKVEPPTSITESLTNEYLTLYAVAEQYQMKAIIKRMDDIKKVLSTYANEHLDDTKPAIFTSDKGEIEFSERGKVAVVKNAMDLVRDLIEKFDHDVAFSVVDIQITPLRKILGEAELLAYLDEKPGSRILRSVRPTKA